MAEKDDFEIRDISVVPAPRCENCMHTMEPHDSTRWACATLDCIEKGKPIHTGAYPFNRVHDLIMDDIEGPPPTEERKEALRKWVEDYGLRGLIKTVHVECDCEEDPFITAGGASGPEEDR